MMMVIKKNKSIYNTVYIIAANLFVPCTDSHLWRFSDTMKTIAACLDISFAFPTVLSVVELTGFYRLDNYL